MSLPPYLKTAAGGVYLAVKLQPRASKNAVAGVMGSELRIAVTAPPVDSAANQALVEFIAERLGCSRGQVQLTRGQTSRHKTLFITGVTAESVASELTPAG